MTEHDVTVRIALTPADDLEPAVRNQAAIWSAFGQHVTTHLDDRDRTAPRVDITVRVSRLREIALVAAAERRAPDVCIANRRPAAA